MDWIFFGDDWGRHVSTTQHLVLNLPAADRVIWVDSIGMRAPGLRRADLVRLWGKARGVLQDALARPRDLAPPAAGTHYTPATRGFARIQPRVLPLHLHPAAVRLNAWSLARAVRRAMRRLDYGAPTLVFVNPAVIRYVHAIPHRRSGYLRLDNYARFPGVDPELVRRTEEPAMRYVDAVFATARALLPAGHADKACYLPQGVQLEHFAQTPLAPSGRRVLGFYGLISEYIDFALVERVARALPDWQLQLVGNVQRAQIPTRARALPNVRFAPAVPFAELPRLLAGWGAAWAPYRLDEHTLASNPLKIREYLAAGLPAHCTPIPEAAALQHVMISDDAAAIAAWVRRLPAEDTEQQHVARRESMRGETWACRAQLLRTILQGGAA